MINSYGSIFALGHRAVKDILLGDNVEVSEKVDGSQLSFGVIDGELSIRSKGQQLHLGGDNGMFNIAVANIEAMAGGLVANWVYRAEYLRVPKHNTLCYSRVPNNNIMIYDIERGPGTEDYLRWRDRYQEAERIGLEMCPVFYVSIGQDPLTFDTIERFLTIESILGGVLIEGVVVKNYSLFTEEKKIARAKYVSPAFKEKHQKEWKVGNPTTKDVVQLLIDELRTEARWEKSVQHLRDDGRLEGSPRDIGPLIKEAQQDIIKEEEEYIKEKLFQHFKGQITRGAISGLPEWYKERLAKGETWGFEDE